VFTKLESDAERVLPQQWVVSAICWETSNCSIVQADHETISPMIVISKYVRIWMCNLVWFFEAL
jgi:hypothetical protein